MHREPTKFSRGHALVRCWLLLWVSVLTAAAPCRAEIDASVNQTVWKMLYGVSDAQFNDPAWLASDDDGDGLSNAAELAAGTNPFDARSGLAVTSTALSGGNAAIAFTTAPGKLYVLQSTNDLADPGSWAAVSSVPPITGDGATKTLTTSQPGTPTFYRAMVQDQDTDADGLSDWAERITGFDPATAHTHGASDDDHTALTADLAQENVVTVVATKSTATQPANAATPATDDATLTLTRGGTLHFSAITVPLNWSGTAVSGLDYAALPTSVTFPAKVGSVTLTVVPLANANLQAGATVTLVAMPGGGYRVGAARSASAVIAPAGNPSGTGLTGTYYNVASHNMSPYNPAIQFAGAPTLTRVDPTVDFNWNSGSPGGTVTATYFSARWQGQVQPQYSETYYFDVNTDDGVKLWVNGQLLIDGWSYLSTDRIGSIALQAGVLYDIKMEYYQGNGGDAAHLYWYSNSQPKQVIPAARLYPATTPAAPPAITSAPVAVGFVNQPFSFTVAASTSGGAAATFALGSGSGPLPAGLTLNPVTGLITGTPTVAGDSQVALTATNALGIGASVLDIQILNPGSGVSRELWPSLPGPNVSDLPLTTAPGSADTTLTTPEDNAAYPNNTGERLRGYFTAPATGNYYFWLAASNNAELWISDDAEPVNLVRRAWVTAPGTSAENWTDANQPHQRSPWLALVAGQSYYYEVLHNVGGAGASGNLAVGFLQDPMGTAITPVVGSASGVVPGYVLSRYDYPTTTAAAGTLYVTNLSPQGVAASAATGSANLRMLPGNTQAILHFNYGGLSTPRTAYHVHIAPDATGSGPIVFDLDDVDKFHPELKTADGGYLWNITDVGAYTATQIVTAIRQGTTYFNVHTVNYPNGEIRGFLTLVNGSQNPPAPVTDPGYNDDHASDSGAARFLNQAAFGAAPADLASVQSGGYAAWINDQVALPATHLLPNVQAQIAAAINTNLGGSQFDNAWWRAAVTAPDQLRLRLAFALSEILVVSDTNATLGSRPDALASYYDTLADHAFGNFRDLLRAVTLHPVMGYWLNMQGNAKGNLATGYHPNENYAREIMQLFSIGLNRLWPDGSLVLDSSGDLVPTYNQGVITNGFARAFTGWTWHQSLQASGQLPTNFSPATNWFDPMVMVKNYHELGSKTLLNNVVLPAASGYSPTASAVGGSQADTSTAAYDDYGAQDLEKALDSIFYHPNVGPYICRQLIQRLVASNPSPAYLYRVVAKFNDDGTAAHVRGNLTAVVNAILLDGEARNAAAAGASATSGKQREPLLRITGPARTFPFTANSGTYNQTGTEFMTITTANPHHFSAGDVVWLDFSVNNTGTPPAAPANNPTTGSYTILSYPPPTATTFAISTTTLVVPSVVSCSEAANSKTLTVNMAGPAAGDHVYLKFVTGVFPDGFYTVATVPNGSSFTVTLATASPTALSGTVLAPNSFQAANNSTLTVNTTGPAAGGQVYLKFLGNGFPDGVYTVATVPTTSSFTVPLSTTAVTFAQWVPVLVPKTTGYDFIVNPSGAASSAITIGTNANTNLNVGDSVWIVAGTSALLRDAVWTVASVIDERRFTLTNTSTPLFKAESNGGVTLYPLVTPLVNRTGNVALPANKFDMGNTNGQIAQSPLDAPTVFNFFYPDYQYPGSLSANNVTTPEFQLTTDTNIITLTNTIASMLLSSANTNGLSNFKSGSINFDLSPYLGAPYVTYNTVSTTNNSTVTAVTTTTVNATALVNKLGDVLTGGGLSQGVKDQITAFLNNTANFPPTQTATGTTTVPPAAPTLPTTSARDKVRAVVQNILISPEYAIQR